MSAFDSIGSLKAAIREGIAASGTEKSVAVLEREYAVRIKDWAYLAVRKEDDNVYAADLVAAKLFNDEQWANVLATDISDIAYEAVCNARHARHVN